jgi:hypothetical protein
LHLNNVCKMMIIYTSSLALALISLDGKALIR